MGYYKEYLFEDAITWTTDGYAGRVTFRSGKFYSTNVNGVLISHKGFGNKAIAEALNRVAYRYVAQAVIPKLMNNVMEEIVFYYPLEISEQQKISKLFIELDEKILSFEQQLNKLDSLRISLQGNLYTTNSPQPKLRFPDFKEDYHTLTVSEIGEVKTGNTPSTKVKEYWGSNTDETKYIWVTPTDINSSTIERTERTLTSLGWEKARKVPANSLLITCIASIGKNTINLTPAAFNQQINSLTPKQGFDSYYLLHHFNRNKVRLANAGNSSITEIVNKTQFEKFTLRLPKEYEEQRKIGKLFKEVDQLILRYKNMIEYHQILKRALLQSMFV
nr:restriction endonuclease subunit S [Psittacicella melopsittaci]